MPIEKDAESDVEDEIVHVDEESINSSFELMNLEVITTSPPTPGPRTPSQKRNVWKKREERGYHTSILYATTCSQAYVKLHSEDKTEEN